MIRYKFPFSINYIEILSRDTLNSALCDDLNELIQFVSDDLNHNILDSSAYRFNEAPVLSLTEVSYEFAEFLRFYIATLSESTYKNIHVPQKIEEKISINDTLAKKLEDIVVDTSSLRVEFILELIKTILLKRSVRNFRISYRDYHIVSGDDSHEVEFIVDEEFKIKISARNEALGLFYNHKYDSINAEIEGFINLDSKLVGKYFITRSSNLAHAKQLFFGQKDFGLKSKYQFFCEETGADVILIDKENKIHYFKPLTNFSQ